MANETSEGSGTNGGASPAILDAIDDLIDAGFEEKQARAMMKAQYKVSQADLSTKLEASLTWKMILVAGISITIICGFITVIKFFQSL